MSKVNSGQAPSTLIPEYIGSDFDKVITVADNLNDIKPVSENINDVVTVANNILDVNKVITNVNDVALVADNIDYVKDVAEGIEGLPVSGYIGDTPPTQPKVGATWYCTLDGRNYTWYEDTDSGQWVESSPQSTADDPHLAGNIFTLWKRSAAEAGYNLVVGSFEEGGVLTSSTDVLWHKGLDSIYSWGGTFPKVVAPGTDPTLPGSGYVPRTDVLLRSVVSLAFKTIADMQASNVNLRLGESIIIHERADAIFVCTNNPVDGAANLATGTVGITATLDYSRKTDLAAFGIVYSEDSSPASANSAILSLVASYNPPHIIASGNVYYDEAQVFSGNTTVEVVNPYGFFYAGPAVAVAFTHGDVGATGSGALVSFALDLVTAHDYSDDGVIGLRLIRIKNSTHSIRRIFGFHTNFQLYGISTAGIEHNIFQIGTSWNARYHINITSAVTNGYVNENLFQAGNLQNTSSFPSSVASYGVVFDTKDAVAYVNNNNNVFIKPCFQLNVAKTADPGVDRIPVLFDEAGTRNSLQQCRVEGFTNAVMAVKSKSHAVCRNKMDVLTLIGGDVAGYFVRNDLNGLGYDNIVKHDADSGDVNFTWNSGSLADKCKAYNTARLTSSEIFFQDGDSANTIAAGIAKLLWDGIQLPSGRGCGVWVDTRINKEFSVTISEKTANSMRVVIVAYDGLNNILTDAGANAPYVAGFGSYAANKYGGGYSAESNFGSEVKFRVQEDVKRIKVIVDGTASTINNMQITAKPNSRSPSGINVYSGNSVAIGTAQDSPATIKHGSYATRGDIRLNANAASGTVAYWQCTLSGYNPDSWVAATNYVSGELVANSANAYLCVDGGTSGATGPTGTGTGIADGSCKWNYIGPIATWTAGPGNP